MKKLNSVDLKNKLINLTIGAGKNNVSRVEKSQIFLEYIRRAFPELKPLSVNLTNTTAALNSVSGIIQIKFPDGSEKTVFGKVHIESNTKSISPLGAEKEYKNAQLLADAGWPVLVPSAIGQVSDYPLLLYPIVKEPALFDILENDNVIGKKSSLTKMQLESLNEYNKIIGQKEISSIKIGTIKESVNAPVQTLLLKRFLKGERIDQWYKSTTLFKLPGLTESISWKKLLDIRWIINDIKYTSTLREIINQARRYLSFEGEKNTLLTISHGDDHAGNVRLTNSPTAFDPAFAGFNPIALDVKALAHTGFLPMGAMYYLPLSLKFNYKKKGDILYVVQNIQELPNYPIHETLAKQIIDNRFLPIIKKTKDMGANIKNEIMRTRYGMAGCALLTVNIAKLLEEGDGRAVGLLPMTIMFAQLRGLPMLDYLNKELQNLTKN